MPSNCDAVPILNASTLNVDFHWPSYHQIQSNTFRLRSYWLHCNRHLDQSRLAVRYGCPAYYTFEAFHLNLFAMIRNNNSRMRSLISLLVLKILTRLSKLPYTTEPSINDVAWLSCCRGPKNPVGAGAERMKLIQVILYFSKFGSPGPEKTGKHSGCIVSVSSTQQSIGLPS